MRKLARLLMFATIALVLLVCAGVVWLGTQSALERIADMAVSRTAGRLIVEGARGTLVGPMSFARLGWRDGGLSVIAEDVDLDYRPLRLIDGTLAIRDVKVGNLVVDVTPSTDSSTTTLPERIALPVDLDIGRVDVRRVEWRIGERDGALVGVQFGFVARPREIVLSALDARWIGGALAGDVRMGAQHPFPLSGKLGLALVDPNPETSVAATLSGTLEALQVEADATIAQTPATARVTLAPFARQPLVEAQVDARQVDLHALRGTLPATKIDLALQAKPTASGFAGTLRASNADAGPIDRERLPISSIEGAFALDGDRLAFSNLTARGAGGHIAGSGDVDLATTRNRWDLRVEGIDLALVHGALVKTTLAGRIRADVERDVQRVDASVSDRDIALDLKARYDGATLQAESFTARSRGSVLEGKGELRLDAARPFSVTARARRFDPSRFGAFPAGAIDASGDARGTLEPALAAQGRVVIDPASRLGRRMLAGRVEGRIAPGLVSDLDADLTVGSSRLTAKGGMGRPGQRLVASFATRDLGELSDLVPKGVPTPLAGALDAEATLEMLAGGMRIAATAKGSGLAAGTDYRATQFTAKVAGIHDGTWQRFDLLATRELALDVDAKGLAVPGGAAATLVARIGHTPQGTQATQAGPANAKRTSAPPVVASAVALGSIDLDATGVDLREQGKAKHVNLKGTVRYDPRLRALRDDFDPALIASASVALSLADVVTPSGSAGRIQATLEGTPAAHTLSANATDGSFSGNAKLTGAVSGRGRTLAWRGRAESFSLAGVPSLGSITLAEPAGFELGYQRFSSSPFRLAGSGGALLDVVTLDWKAGALETRGKLANFPVAPWLRAAGLDPDYPVDLTVGGAWDVRSAPRWEGTLRLVRERGDIYVDDASGDAPSRIALGLEALELDARFAGERLVGTTSVQSRRGGEIRGDFEIVAPAGSANPLSREAALRGNVQARMPSLAALQPWIGTGARVQGRLTADLALSGTLGSPVFNGRVEGDDLRVDVPEIGLNLQRGVLRARSDSEGIRVETLSFAGGEGTFNASGLIRLPRQGTTPDAGTQLTWRAEKFRLLNRPDQRVVVDGNGALQVRNQRLLLTGSLNVLEGFIEYRSTASTRLADDIVVVGSPRPGRGQAETNLATSTPLDLDLALTLGQNLRLSTEGLDTGLTGRITLTSSAGGPLLARGRITTVRGSYWAFGQRLTIDRGVLIFDGPATNPALDIVALRKNLAVEAGVEIRGTARAPVVRITSNPPVPENEALSWLLTGGPSGSESQREAAAIQAAAATLIGDRGRPFTQQIAESFGLDDISVAQRSTTTATETTTNNVVSLGKRLSDNIYVSFEQGLTVATNVVRIEYVLSRYFTVSAFAGTDSGLALNYRRSWR